VHSFIYDTTLSAEGVPYSDSGCSNKAFHVQRDPALIRAHNTDVELRRRITNAKRTPAGDLPAIHRRTQGVSSNAGYVPQNP